MDARERGFLLGNNFTMAESQTPSVVNVLCELRVKVLSVSCGALHNLALTDCGVFGWGSSCYGQLGLHKTRSASRPLLIDSLLRHSVISIQCGQYHSLALTCDGRVLSWGWGVHGQLGHGDPEDVYVPKEIQMGKKSVAALAAGQGHSVIITNSGEVYTFGCGMFGQLGTGTSLKHSLPQFIALPEPVVLIASGYFHVVAVSTTNKVYTWGCNPQSLRLQAQYSRKYRQNSSQKFSQNKSFALSTESSQDELPNSEVSFLQQTHLKPTMINCAKIDAAISQVACGTHHSMILTSSGKLYGWGRNIEGQLGNGTRKEQKTPTLVTSLKAVKIVSVSSGADFSIAVAANEGIWGWGKNNSCQLGQKSSGSDEKQGVAGSSSERIITIRTNRRMITITQPNRQSFLVPTEIFLPKSDTPDGVNDSGSYENGNSIPMICQQNCSKERMQNGDSFSSYDEPAYGLCTLHASLKKFHTVCDISSLLPYCLKFSNYQAAATVCMLKNRITQAFCYQLEAIVHDNTVPAEKYSTLALHAFEFYTRLLEPSNADGLSKLFYNAIEFWLDYKLPVSQLESFLVRRKDVFSYPICRILCCQGMHDSRPLFVNQFLGQLSTEFCLSICTDVQLGSQKAYFLEQIVTECGTTKEFTKNADVLTAWNHSVPVECLWKEILQNIQKGMLSKNSFELTGCDIDCLTKSLANEKLCSQIKSNNAMKGNILRKIDIVVFSCNHYYTMEAFNYLLPEFRETVLKLYSQITSLLLANFRAQKFVPLSCPKCVLNEMKIVM